MAITEEGARNEGHVTIVALIGVLFIATLLVVFGAQNAQPVSLYFFRWESSPVPLVLALGLAMLLGALLSFLVSFPGRVQAWRERRGLRHEVEAQHVAAARPESSAARSPQDPDEPRPPSEV